MAEAVVLDALDQEVEHARLLARGQRLPDRREDRQRLHDVLLLECRARDGGEGLLDFAEPSLDLFGALRDRRESIGPLLRGRGGQAPRFRAQSLAFDAQAPPLRLERRHLVLAIIVDGLHDACGEWLRREDSNL